MKMKMLLLVLSLIFGLLPCLHAAVPEDRIDSLPFFVIDFTFSFSFLSVFFFFLKKNIKVICWLSCLFWLIGRRSPICSLFWIFNNKRKTTSLLVCGIWRKSIHWSISTLVEWVNSFFIIICYLIFDWKETKSLIYILKWTWLFKFIWIYVWTWTFQILWSWIWRFVIMFEWL